MDLLDLTVEKPKTPSAPKGEDVDETDREIWKEEVKECVRRKNSLNNNIKKLSRILSLMKIIDGGILGNIGDSR